MFSLAHMCKVANYVASCSMIRVVEPHFTTNRLTLAALNTVTGQLHSPGSGGDKGMFGGLLIALVAVENRLVFPKPPLSFFLLFYRSMLFVVGFLVLMSGLFLSWIADSAHDIKIVFCVLK